MKTPQQNIGNSMEPRLYQGQALRVCAVRTALTEPSLHAHPESGKGDGAADAHPLTSGGAQVLGLIIKELPTNSADEAEKVQHFPFLSKEIGVAEQINTPGRK